MLLRKLIFLCAYLSLFRATSSKTTIKIYTDSKTDNIITINNRNNVTRDIYTNSWTDINDKTDIYLNSTTKDINTANILYSSNNIDIYSNNTNKYTDSFIDIYNSTNDTFTNSNADIYNNSTDTATDVYSSTNDTYTVSNADICNNSTLIDTDSSADVYSSTNDTYTDNNADIYNNSTHIDTDSSADVYSSTNDPYTDNNADIYNNSTNIDTDSSADVYSSTTDIDTDSNADIYSSTTDSYTDSSTDIYSSTTDSYTDSSTDIYGSITDSYTDSSTDIYGSTTDSYTDSSTDIYGSTTDSYSDSSTDIYGSTTDSYTDSFTDIYGSTTDSYTDSSTDIYGSTTDSYTDSSTDIYGSTTDSYTDSSTDIYGSTTNSYTDSSTDIYGSTTDSYTDSSTDIYGSTTDSYTDSSSDIYGSTTDSYTDSSTDINGSTTDSYTDSSTDIYGSTTDSYTDSSTDIYGSTTDSYTDSSSDIYGSTTDSYTDSSADIYGSTTDSYTDSSTDIYGSTTDSYTDSSTDIYGSKIEAGSIQHNQNSIFDTSNNERMDVGGKKLSENIVAILEHYKQPDPLGIPGGVIPDPCPLADSRQMLTAFDTLYMKHSLLYGVSKLRIWNINADVKNLEVHAAMSVGALQARGDYSIGMWFNSASGPYTINVTDLKLLGRANLGVEQDGKLQTQDIHMDISISSMTTNFENLNFIGGMMQNFINAGGTSFFDSTIPYVLRDAYAKIRADINTKLDEITGGVGFTNSISPLDMLLIDIRKFIRNMKLDPLRIDNINKTVSIFNVAVSNTYIIGISSFQRVGNVTVSMENNTLVAEFDVGTGELEGRTQWDISTLGGQISRTMKASFSVEYIRASTIIAQPLDTRISPTLRNLDLDLGNIQARSNGLGTLDYIFEFSVNVLPNLLRYQILDAVENIIKQIVQQKLSAVNVEKTIKQNLPTLDELQGFKLSYLRSAVIDKETYDEDEFFNF